MFGRLSYDRCQNQINSRLFEFENETKKHTRLVVSLECVDIDGEGLATISGENYSGGAIRLISTIVNDFVLQVRKFAASSRRPLYLNLISAQDASLLDVPADVLGVFSYDGIENLSEVVFSAKKIVTNSVSSLIQLMRNPSVKDLRYSAQSFYSQIEWFRTLTSAFENCPRCRVGRSIYNLLLAQCVLKALPNFQNNIELSPKAILTILVYQGLTEPSEWNSFLTQGLYDPRLLLLISGYLDWFPANYQRLADGECDPNCGIEEE